MDWSTVLIIIALISFVGGVLLFAVMVLKTIHD